MHGSIFTLLKKFVDHAQGDTAWQSLLESAGLWPKFYLTFQEYPDAEMTAIVAAAAAATGKPARRIQELFGEFIAPELLRMYPLLVEPKWRTLDLIEHTEETIHRVVRARNPGASPPMLRCERTGPRQVVVLYDSKRKMCAVAMGIVRGLAAHFNDHITMYEESCMHRGDKECRIVVNLADGAGIAPRAPA